MEVLDGLKEGDLVIVDMSNWDAFRSIDFRRASRSTNRRQFDTPAAALVRSGQEGLLEFE